MKYVVISIAKENKDNDILDTNVCTLVIMSCLLIMKYFVVFFYSGNYYVHTSYIIKTIQASAIPRTRDNILLHITSVHISYFYCDSR